MGTIEIIIIGLGCFCMGFGIATYLFNKEDDSNDIL